MGVIKVFPAKCSRIFPQPPSRKTITLLTLLRGGRRGAWSNIPLLSRRLHDLPLILKRRSKEEKAEANQSCAWIVVGPSLAKSRLITRTSCLHPAEQCKPPLVEGAKERKGETSTTKTKIFWLYL